MKTKHAIAVFALIVVAAVVSAVMAASVDKKQPADKLPAVEVREFKGEKLGSVKDFRENSIKGPQRVDIRKYRLAVDGLVDAPKSLKYSEAAGRKRFSKVVTLHCVEGWSVKILWEGVRVRDIIAAAKPRKAANTVIFHSVDGYTTSLPLDFVVKRNLLLADKMNGIRMPPERGYPFELVAEDKWGYKWIKWVNRIELSDDPGYEGYWERRGYSNSGDLKSGY